MIAKRFKVVAFSVLMVFITLLATAGPALADPPKVRVLIGFDKTQITAKQRDYRITLSGGRVKHAFRRIPVVSAEVPAASLAQLRKMRGISFVEEDGVVDAVDEVDILAQQVPWGIARVNAPPVHPYNKGTDVKVAVIDTGIDYNHPDLDANYKGGYDFYYEDNNPMDDNGHGTHVAGILAAEDNDAGVVGVAPEADIYAVKVLSASGSGYVSDVVQGIQWAIDNHMQVITMSLGVRSDYASLRSACNAAYDAGIIVLAAAGNSGNSGGTGINTLYPATYDSVIAVAATTSTDAKASYSSTGPAVELAAPGDSIYSTWRTNQYGGYTTKSGTSMACPHAAGVAALAIGSGMTDRDLIRTRLQETATDLGNSGRDNKFGFGLVNASSFAEVNAPPSAPVVSVEPATAFTDQPLTATIVEASIDPDDDTIEYSYAWSLGGQILTEGLDASVLAPENTEKGQTWTCAVTPYDGRDYGDAGEASAYIQNTPPVASAGDDQYLDFETGTVVTMNGSGSSDIDAADSPLGFSWAQTSGPAVLLSDPLAENPAFTPPEVGEYLFALTVTDGDAEQSSDEVGIYLVPSNPAPELVFGGVDPGSGIHSDLFTYSVTYKDVDGEPALYVNISIDAGPEQAMSSTGGLDYQNGVEYQYNINTTGLDLGVGDHACRFSAYDGHKVTVLDITGPTVINTPPDPPTVVSIDQVDPDTTAELTVSFLPSADLDGDPITYTYLWSTAGKSCAGPTLPPADTTRGEAWSCTVTANDNHLGSASSLASAEVTIINSPPVANAGPDRDEEKNSSVILNGNGSSDADGDSLTFLWEQTGGLPVDLAGAATDTAAFTPGVIGLYSFTLTVSDGSGLVTDAVVINVIVPHTIHVESINMSLVYQYSGWRTSARAVITILNAEGVPMSGATVTGHWTGGTRDVETGTTDAAGTVTFNSDFLRRPAQGTAFTINIDSVSLGGWTWDNSDPSSLRATITVQ
jgi:subtilisin family serine protease